MSSADHRVHWLLPREHVKLFAGENVRGKTPDIPLGLLDRHIP